MCFNIKEYGAVGDGVTLDTAAIQRAMDACAQAEGGTVFVPPGCFLTGTLMLHSHVELHIARGATLLGSTELDRDFAPDEPREEPLYQDHSHSYFHHSLLYGEHLENVAITGGGIIDMQSAWEQHDGRGPMRRGAKIVALRECRGVTVTGLTLRNATDLALYFAGCESVRVSGITADVHIDGISPDCCKDMVISDCIIRSGDDAIVPKSSYTLGRLKMCENVTVTGCVISSRCNAFKLGTESNGGYRNIAVSNLSIYNTRFAGIALEVVDGGILEGVSISNVTMRNVGTPLFLILADRRRGPEGTGIGTIRDVFIHNVVATGPYESWHAIRESIECDSDIQKPVCVTSTITGQPGHPVENICLSDIRLCVPGGGTAADAERIVPEDPKSYPETTRFGPMLPAYGLYCRHCDGLTLRNVSMHPYAEDARPAYRFDDAKNVRLDGVTGCVEQSKEEG